MALGIKTGASENGTPAGIKRRLFFGQYNRRKGEVS